MKQSYAISLNQHVKFKLTEYGEEVKNSMEYNGIGNKDEGGYYKTQLWHFIHIFGEHIWIGMKTVIKDNLIYIESE